MIKLKSLLTESDAAFVKDWLERHNAQLDNSGRLIAYHGTTASNAKLIKQNGFKEGSYFSLRKEYSQRWGKYVFTVHLPMDAIDFVASDIVAIRPIAYNEILDKNDVISEEKEAFQKERNGKIKFDIKPVGIGGKGIQMYLMDEPLTEIGYCNLFNSAPHEDLGAMPSKPKYLFVDTIKVYPKYQQKGYGFLLYKEALKYAQKNGFKGLVSSKTHRSDKARAVWDKLKTFSDRDYDYVDIKDLGTRIK